MSRRRCEPTGGSSKLHDDHFAEDTPDEVILEAVAESGWVLVTQDRRIRNRAAELDALIQHGVRAFFIASTANLSLDELDAPFVVAIYKDASTRRIV